ncbi:MAG: formylglycine-generating enzyme family protein, partial [Leptospiraceae bacterium]|nr:formylglycine-generating enzyme family protein [Leptospiraceae bacterium]
MGWSFRNSRDQKPYIKMEDESFGKLPLSLGKKSPLDAVAGIFAGDKTTEKIQPEEEAKPEKTENKDTVEKSFSYSPAHFEPLPKGKPKTFTNSIGMKFNLLPAGEFDMGCSKEDSSCGSDESPAHRVKLSNAFYMGVHEVTQKQWRDVMGKNPSYFVGADCNSPNGCDNNPVENVSWNDVQEFIKKL